MAETKLAPEEARTAFLSVMEKAEALVDGATGEIEGKSLSPGQLLVFGLWMSCRDLHEAISTLLARDFYVESRILARALVTDFLRLAFLYENHTELEAWTIRYMLASFDEEERTLVKSASELRLTFAPELAKQVRQGKSEWQQRATAAGVKQRSFPDYPELVRAAGRDEVRFLIKFLNHAVHSNRSAIELRLRSRAREADEKELLGEVVFSGYDTTLALLMATKVAGCILDWQKACVQELGDDLREEMERILSAAGVALVEIEDEPAPGRAGAP